MGKRENEGKKEKKQKKERKIKRKQYGGLLLNPISVPRARTRTRGMSYGDINNIPLTVIPRARAHIREEGTPRSEAALAEWRTKTFGGDFDPVREAVEDAVKAFSYRQPEDDRRIWLKVANEIGYEAFRDLYLEQVSIMRECKLRNPSAAFQNRLNRYTNHSPTCTAQGSGRSPVRSPKKGGAA